MSQPPNLALGQSRSQPPTLPDVLGQLTSERLTLGDVVQCAVGVFPQAAALNQPLEVLLLLQNLTDQPLPLTITTRTPTRDGKGHLLNIFVRQPRYALELPPADVGLLHVPIMAQLPTPPGEGYPVRVQIDVAKPDLFGRVRSVQGGDPPGLLSVSPFRLTVLKEINFGARAHSENQLITQFDLLGGEFPLRDDEPVTKYEPLWTLRDLEQQRARAEAKAPEALNYVNNIPQRHMARALSVRANQAFADAGMPLHPGEAVFITKLLSYTMEDGLELEEGFSLASSRWFRRLCGLMADDPRVTEALDRMLQLVFPSAVHDAVLLGFSMVTSNTGIDFGAPEEIADFADKVVAALEGRMPLSLEHIYVPMVMAGVLLNHRVTLADENPWQALDALKEARDGRINLTGAGFREVFDILNRLIGENETLLTELRIARPG